jgi:hypothetical protein
MPEAIALRDAQKGRSLKYCDGNWIADPAKPWKIKASVSGWPQGRSRPTLPDGGAGWRESWSHEFSLDSLISSSSGMPLKWSLSQSSISVNEGPSTFNRGVVWSIADNNKYDFGQARQFAESSWSFGLLATSECTGCNVKFVVSVSVSLQIPMSQFGAIYGDSVLFDTLYCSAYSPCVASGGASWSSPATARTMSISSSQSYGYSNNFGAYLGISAVSPNANDSFTFEF